MPSPSAAGLTTLASAKAAVAKIQEAFEEVNIDLPDGKQEKRYTLDTTVLTDLGFEASLQGITAFAAAAADACTKFQDTELSRDYGKLQKFMLKNAGMGAVFGKTTGGSGKASNGNSASGSPPTAMSAEQTIQALQVMTQGIQEMAGNLVQQFGFSSGPDGVKAFGAGVSKLSNSQGPQAGAIRAHAEALEGIVRLFTGTSGKLQQQPEQTEQQTDQAGDGANSAANKKRRDKEKLKRRGVALDKALAANGGKSFLPAAAFDGSKAGYVFRGGESGTGYYLDYSSAGKPFPEGLALPTPDDGSSDVADLLTGAVADALERGNAAARSGGSASKPLGETMDRDGNPVQVMRTLPSGPIPGCRLDVAQALASVRDVTAELKAMENKDMLESGRARAIGDGGGAEGLKQHVLPTLRMLQAVSLMGHVERCRYCLFVVPCSVFRVPCCCVHRFFVIPELALFLSSQSAVTKYGYPNTHDGAMDWNREVQAMVTHLGLEDHDELCVRIQELSFVMMGLVSLDEIPSAHGS